MEGAADSIFRSFSDPVRCFGISVERVVKFRYTYSCSYSVICQKSGFTRALHGCITLGVKSRRRPQNTSTVVGNLKQIFVLADFSVSFRKTDPKRETKTNPPPIKLSYWVQTDARYSVRSVLSFKLH